MLMNSNNTLTSTSISFADNSNIFVTGDNANAIYSKANQELKNMNAWMVANKLSINISKTVHIFFGQVRVRL